MKDCIELIPKKNISGEVIVPGSKSITNRALLYASLASGVSIIEKCLFADDTEIMIAALMKLGIKIEKDGTTLKIHGVGGKFNQCNDEVFLGNAGTAMRFLTAISCLVPGETVLTGDDRMKQRPIGDLLQALNQAKIRASSKNNNLCPPILVPQDKFEGGTIKISGLKSSQYLSALFHISPFSLNADTIIKITDHLTSKPYIDITIATLKQFGIQVINEDYKKFVIPHSQKYQPTQFIVEGDASSASYFLGLAAVSGGDITIKNVGKKSIQGDREIARVFEKMGCKVTYSDYEINLKGPDKLKALGEINLEDMPDSAMTVACVSALTQGTTKITGLSNLRIKECNRLKALVTELKKCGLYAKELEDGICIIGGISKPAIIDTYNDHRMAMCFAVISSQIQGVKIKNPSCVNKTYKNFWKDINKLGIETK